MTPELFPYQRAGAEFLASQQHALLCDEMGLGKTPQAIEAASLVGARRIIVVCPAIARHNWAAEFARFAPRHVPLVIETAKRNVSAQATVLIVSYDLATTTQLHPALCEFGADVLILDEGHALKNMSAKRTRAIYGRLRENGALIKYARHVWVLTGTPAPNNPAELYPHFRALFPRTLRALRLDEYARFEEHFCITRDTPFGTQITGARNTEELRGLLAPVMLRRRKVDVLRQLPPLRFESVAVSVKLFDQTLAELERHPDIRAFRAMLERAVLTPAQLDAAQLPAGVVATIRRLTGVAKAHPAAALITQELTDDPARKMVVFAQHREVLDILGRRLGPFGTVRVDGSVSGTKRKDAIDSFQNDAATRVFLGQLQAASTAVTLTAASDVLFVEASWTPADNLQAANRCHRIGQTSSVLARFLTLANSIDEAVTGTLRRKTRMLNEMLQEA